MLGFCTDHEYWEFVRTVPQFERMLHGAGVQLVKYWFSVSHQVQAKRFADRLSDPAKRWKFSDIDTYSLSKWTECSRAKDVMMEHTSIPEAPWWEVDGYDKRRARLNTISHLLSLVPYEPLEYPPITLPKTKPDAGYQRPPIEKLNWIPEPY